MSVRRFLKMGLCCGITLGLMSFTGNLAAVTEGTVAPGGEVKAAAQDDDRLFTDLTETDLFEGWDIDNDNLLAENEYSVAFFDTWDINEDENLDEDEWNTALADYGLDDDPAWAWATWNTDNDAFVEEEEFDLELGDTEYFAVWDVNDDNLLDEREYAKGIYALWIEAEDDGILDDNEYKDIFIRYYDVDAVKLMPERG